MKKTKKLWILLTFPLLLGMASCKSGDGNNPEYQAYKKRVPILLPFVPIYSVKDYGWLKG